MRRLGFLLLAVFLFIACSKDEQAVDSRARILFIEDTLLTFNSVYATLDDGNSSWQFEPHNFIRIQSDSTRFTSPEVQTRGSGVLTVTFRVTKSGGNTVCDGSLGAYLSPNWRWSFELMHALTDSAYACGDCFNTSRFEIFDPDYPGQSIYVFWRGRGP